MNKRGRPKKEIQEDQWVPEVKYYKRKERVEINAFAKRKQERLLAGYISLFKTVHKRNPEPNEMKRIYKTIRGIDL